MNDQTPTNELVEVRTLVPADVFGPGGAEAIIKALTDKVLAVPTDISTAAGRKAIASLAYKVARSKTALDEMGKDLAADLKKRTSAIDAERRVIRDRLEALQEQVRKPLTDWENAEKNRVADHEEALARIAESPDYGRTETAEELRQRLEYLLDYPARDWQEFSARATKALEDEIERTTRLWEAARTREAEQAELERLRAEQTEREQRERDEQIAREAAEKARLEAEAKARAEAEAVERARREADENAARARALAEAKAREEQERVEREKAAAEKAARAAEERARKAEADRAAAEAKAKADAEETAARAERERIAAAEKAERDRLTAVEAERRRVAEEQARVEREAAAREANKRHRAKVNASARDALVAAGLSENAATLAVTTIAQGAVPNVKITY